MDGRTLGGIVGGSAMPASRPVSIRSNYTMQTGDASHRS
jgi:hypothetical protein